METILKNPILEYHSDTLQYIREGYGFDHQRMKESIDIIEEWVKKQEHFVKKIFPRDYLERIIVHNKGSVEKSKRKLDKICTLRTLIPEFFDNFNIQDIDLTQDICDNYLLPKMTPDYYRVHMFKIRDTKYSAQNIKQNLGIFLLVADYLQTYDYCNGLIYFADWRDGNPFDYAMTVNISDFRKTMDIAFEGYSMKIIGIHLLTASKAIDTFVALFKQVLSPKIAKRIHVHKSMETVYKYVPKDILPVEYGGKEKPLAELNENLMNELGSEEFKNYRQDINEGRTNEAFRPKHVFNEYMGMSGTFRNLSVD